MRTVLAACSAALLVAALNPSQASAAGVATCRLTYGSDSGITSGSGTCTATPGGSFTLAFTAQNGCPFQSASGTASGAVRFSFNWTRIGSVGAITMSGDLDHASYAAWSSPCPTSGETMTFAG